MSKVFAGELRPTTINVDLLPDRLLTPAQFAEYVGTSVAQLAQQRYRGEGPKYVKTGAKSVRYRWSDIQQWLAANTRQQTSE